MARFRLIPREEKFFADFVAMSEQIRLGARELQEMFGSEPPQHAKAEIIKQIEHKCDYLTHEIIQRLNKTFVTPFDREDIHSLALTLDDVMDEIDAVAALVPLYHISSVRYGARELAAVIVQAADKIKEAVEKLESRKGVLELSREINKLEHDADEIHQQAVGQLYDNERDPIVVMKWKEILDNLEFATDRCEDVANLLETIVVKHS